MNQGTRKVLFLITKATWGGAQKYVYDLATHLPQGKYEAAAGYGGRGRLSAMLEERGIATYAVPALGRDVAVFSDIASFFRIFSLLRHVRPHVLHVNSSKAAALGALAARLAGVPKIVFTVHGWPFKEDRAPTARALIYFVSWLTAALAHATIVVSKRDVEIGRRMRLAGKKIHYIPLGIEPPIFLSREEASAALSISTRAPRIVTIGELIPNKGIQYAIDAVAELKKRNIPRAYFVIGGGELREKLEEHAIERQVENDVVFLGFVENAAMYLKAFDMFLLPSIKEGMPYVLLEAAQAGLPIVATNVIDKSFQPSSTLVPPANPAMLAEALERAIEQRKEPATKANYALEKMTVETVRLYS